MFPDVYDHNPTGDGSNRLRLHVEKAIEMVEGQVPVYVQASPRYKLQGGQYDLLHTVEEFMHDQVDAALEAVWTDADGTEHRIAGISMWDAYVYFWWYTNNWTSLDTETQKTMWDELDAYHVELLGHMKTSVDAAQAAAIARNEEANQTEIETTTEQTQNETEEVDSTHSQTLSVQTIKVVSSTSVTKSSLTSRAKWNSAKTTWKVASLKR